MSIAKFSVRNSVLINMIMIMVFIAGIYAMTQIPKEEMPQVEFGMVIITVAYPGVSPAEIEQMIVTKIEDEIADIDDIDFIESTATEGSAMIRIRFETDADMDEAWDEVNTEMDKVNDLPEDAMDPILIRLNMKEVNEICSIVVSGDFHPNTMRDISDTMKQGLTNVKNVSKVEVGGTREREIWIEGDLEKLNAYGLSLNNISNSVANRNLNVPGGSVQFGSAEFIIRSMGEFNSLSEIRNLPIMMDRNGRAVRIKDVATVIDTLEDSSVISKQDGENSITLEVYKKAQGNIVTVMQDVKAYCSEFEKTIPDINVTIRDDGSIAVKSALTSLGANAIVGIILVFIILTLFLGWRNALFAAWGIPFSFFLTFVAMFYFGVTMNNLSLFALVLVLGMIVDDAIVVIENYHRYMEMGYSRYEAAIQGTEEIMWPVIAAILTTIASFSPIMFMKGVMGQFMRVFPLVVMFALLASLFESLIILPSHLAELGPKKLKEKKKNTFYDKLVKRYRCAVTNVLKHRFITIFIVVVLLILSGMALMFRMVRFEFFPRRNTDTLVLQLETPVGTSLEQTNEVVSKVEQFVANMVEHSDIEAVITQIGLIRGRGTRSTSSNNAEVKLDMVDIEQRNYDDFVIKNKLREFMKNLPGLYSFKFDQEGHGPPTGNDVEIRITGDSLEKLEYIGEYIKAQLAQIPGISDIDDSFDAGKQEIQIIPYQDRLSYYGLTASSISSAVRLSSNGSNISIYRGDGIEEYDIVLKAKETQVDDLSELKNMKIRSTSGALIPLKDIAEFKVENGLSQIQHRDSDRYITITAAVGKYTDSNGHTSTRTTDEVQKILDGDKIRNTKGLLTDFNQKFPGYYLSYGGVHEMMKESYSSLYLAFLIAILGVYTILATQFKSYIQPLIVMATIPFAFIGVVLGLILTGLPFSLNTLIAVVALIGVVVNDSLVLVDFVNREREQGVDRWNSLINAGALRLRPIILTTVTTVGGMLPMIFSSAESSADYKSMAVSIVFGLSFATLLTLFVIPTIYSLVDSIAGRLHASRFHSHISFKDATINTNKDIDNKDNCKI